MALSGAPDWTLMCWNWAKAKLIASITVSAPTSPVYRCMFSPLDVTVSCVIGRDCVKFFRTGEKEMRMLHENIIPNHNFTSFCWMRSPDDHLLVGTDEGKILLFRSGEFLLMIPCSPGPSYPITSLCAIIGGFTAGSAAGTFFFFQYDDSKSDQIFYDSQFKLANTVASSDSSSGMIVNLALDPKDEVMCGLTSDGQILSLSTVGFETATSENIQYAVSAFHGKSITGMLTLIFHAEIYECLKA